MPRKFHFACKKNWEVKNKLNIEQLRCAKAINCIFSYITMGVPSTSTQPLVVTHSLLVNNDCTWKLYVWGYEVKPSTNDLLKPIPITLNQTSFIELLTIVDLSTVCPGNCDAHFTEMGHARKGNFETSNGETKAIVEEGSPLTLNGNTFTSSVSKIVKF